MRERDVPMVWVGVLEECLAASLVGGGFVALGPYQGGSTILFGAGAVTALVGLVQLTAPAKNEVTIFPQ